MDYKNIAASVLEQIGGAGNISHVTHCATRLRITLVDNTQVNKEQVQSINGVLGVVNSANQLQIIFGQHVSHVYDFVQELIKGVGDTPKKSAPEQNVQKVNILSLVIDTITGIFTPILSAITGAAMVKVLLILLTISGVLSKESDTYFVLNFISDAAFYFLPLMLAHSAAQKFKMNPFLAMAIGGVLIHPAFSQIKNTKDSLSFVGIDVPLVSYGASVIPIILVIWLASYIEKAADKVSPKSLTFFMKPFLTVVITAPLALILIAPAGMYVGEVLSVGIEYINENMTWLLPVIFGVFAPIFIMTGMHYALAIPLMITSITAYGFDMIGVGFLVANIAQGAAALAVARLAKDTEFKSTASASGLTAILGITEPALYGVNLKYKKPFFAVMIAGGIGGLYAGMFAVKKMALAPSGLTTIAAFIDTDNSMNIVHAVIGVIISFVVAYVLTTVLMRKETITN